MLKVSSEVFQARMVAALDDLPGVYFIADDFLVVGTDGDMSNAVATHDENVIKFLDRCKIHGIVLHPREFKFRTPSVDFMGHVLTENGFKVDPEKISAITNMPTPTDVPSLRRFLGTVGYFSKFLPKLAGMTKPLTALSAKHVIWSWEPEHDRAINKVKKLITQVSVLKHYDPDIDLIDQTWLRVRCHPEGEFKPLLFLYSCTIQGPESTC